MKHELPDGLSPLAIQVANKIIDLANEHGLRVPPTHRIFYTPQEWDQRGEDYGTDSMLIVVHDGDEIGALFSYDHECYAFIESTDAALKAIGAYAEPCTMWYTAIYPTEEGYLSDAERAYNNGEHE